MIWFYERRGVYQRFETRDVAEQPGKYELVRLLPDGSEIVERFDTSEALMERQVALEAELSDGGWQGPYGRFF